MAKAEETMVADRVAQLDALVAQKAATETEVEDRPALSLPTETIPSDDCVVMVGDKTYHPHVGEWVSVIRGPKSIRELKLVWNFNAFQVEMEGLQSDHEEARREMLALIERIPTADDETEKQKKERAKLQVDIDKQLEVMATLGQKRYDLMRDRYDAFAAEVAEHLVDWNWTNRVGRPLQKPDGSIDPLQDLNPDEIYYLRQVVGGEGPAERKNGSAS